MQPALKPWMFWLLRFAGTFNLLAALGMVVFYNEGFKLLGLKKPDMNMPVQLVGLLVGLFGVGYHLVASNAVENRNLLTLGFWSKALGSALGLVYLYKGKMPPVFFPVLFFADIIYLPPFMMIIRRLSRLAREERTTAASVSRAKAA